MKSILAFLNQIKENNSKEWLDAHRAEYQVATQSFNLLVEQLIAGISEFDSSIKGITVKGLYLQVQSRYQVFTQ